MGGSAKNGGGASKRWNYHAAGAILICGGKATRLLGIEVREEVKWSGALAEATSPNPVPITVPGYGSGKLYWGRDDQFTPAWLLQAANNDLGHDHPAYTSCCYFVCDDGWLLGLEIKNQPKMRFLIEREPQQALITGPAAALVDGNANPATIIAELYTSRRLGRGMPTALFAASTWQSVADALYAKNAATYVSVLLNQPTNGKTFAQELLALVDGYMRQQTGTGLCEIGLFTPPDAIDTGSLPVINASWLTDKAEWDDETWDDVYSRVIVTYRDRNKNFKVRSERYDDPTALGIVGLKEKTIKRDDIVRSGQAWSYAQKEGTRLAVPGASGKLPVRAEKAIALRPGDHVRVDIDAEPGGAERRKVCRVVKVTRTRGRDTVLEVETERLLDAELVTPSTPAPTTPPEIVIPEITHFRFFETPYPLAGGEPLRIGVLASRPDGLVTNFRVRYDDVSGGDFPILGDSRSYALRGRLNLGYAHDATGDVSVELLDTLNREIIADNPGDTAARDDSLLMIVLKIAGSGQIEADGDDKAWLEIFSVSELVAASTDVVDVTALRARQGSTAHTFAAGAEVWFIRRSALTVLEHADFPRLAADEDPAYFKLQPSSSEAERPVEDCTQRTFSFALVRELPPTVIDDGVTPDPVTDVVLTAGFNTIFIKYTLPENTDLRQIRIYLDMTTTRPSSPQYEAAGRQNFVTIEGMPEGVTRYVWIEVEGTNRRLSTIVGPYSVTIPVIDLGDIEDTIDALLERIDRKITRHPTAPTSPNLGDQWFDTDDGNKPWVWDGFNWQEVKDARITTLEATVNNATTGLTATRAEVISGATTWANADNALASDINALETEVDTVAGVASSAASNAATALSTATGASSTASTALTAAYDSTKKSGNLVENAEPKGPVGWEAGPGNTGRTTGLDVGYTPWAPTGGGSLVIAQSVVLGSDEYYEARSIQAIPVVAAGRYQLSAHLSSHRCYGYVMVAWYDASDTYLSGSGTASTPYDNQVGGAIANWPRYAAFVTAPTSAAIARIYLRAHRFVSSGYTSGAADNALFFTRVYFGRATPTQTEFSEWSPGPDRLRIEAAQTTANAAVTSASAAQATADSAAASASTAVTAATTANTNASAAVTSVAAAQAGVDSLAAEYVLKTVTSVGGVRRVAGFRITNQGGAGGESDFIVQADRVGFVDPDGNNDRYPFFYSDGILYLDTAVIENATIVDAQIVNVSASKIEATSLDAISAVIGLLRTATTGARMEIESNQGRVYNASNVMVMRWGVWS